MTAPWVGAEPIKYPYPGGVQEYIYFPSGGRGFFYLVWSHDIAINIFTEDDPLFCALIAE